MIRGTSKVSELEGAIFRDELARKVFGTRIVSKVELREGLNEHLMNVIL